MSEWRDRAQHWRNGFFEYIKTLKEGERNDGGMDVSVLLLASLLLPVFPLPHLPFY